MRPRTSSLPALGLLLAAAAAYAFDIQEYLVPQGAHPHDVAPAADGGVSDSDIVVNEDT